MNNSNRTDHYAGNGTILMAGILISTIGLLVMLGWALDIAALKSVLPGWVAMKPNAAVAFTLTGIALLVFSIHNDKHSILLSRLSRFCALSAGLIGLLSLCEYVFGWNPSFDQWLFPEPSGAVGTSHLGRMAPDTAFCFMLFAAAWEFARRPRQTNQTMGASLFIGAVITVLAVIEMLSYVTPNLRMYGWEGVTMMALPTAILFAVLGAVIIQGSWWSLFGRRLTRFTRNIMISGFLSILLAAVFALYIQSMRLIDRANELRYRSYQLADELRQSGDDLTRMIRTYVATGDPVYKKIFSGHTRHPQREETAPGKLLEAILGPGVGEEPGTARQSVGYSVAGVDAEGRVHQSGIRKTG